MVEKLLVDEFLDNARVDDASEAVLLSEETTSALFIMDALDPLSDDQLCSAAEDLASHLRRLGPDVHIAQRLLKKHPETKYGG